MDIICAGALCQGGSGGYSEGSVPPVHHPGPEADQHWHQHGCGRPSHLLQQHHSLPHLCPGRLWVQPSHPHNNKNTCGECPHAAFPTSANKAQTFLLNVCCSLTRVSTHKLLARTPTVFWQQTQRFSTPQPVIHSLRKQLLLHSTTITPSLPPVAVPTSASGNKSHLLLNPFPFSLSPSWSSLN